MKNEFKILLVDDHSVVRRGTAALLEKAFQQAIISYADNFEEAIIKLSEKQDLIFLDISIPGGNSTKMVETIRLNHPNLLIMMFSAYDEAHYALRYLHAGANGYLDKYSSDTEIINAVKSLITTKKYISDVVKEKILENALLKSPVNPLERLSEREIEVAELLASGEGNLEISNKLNIKMSTVSTFKTRIFEKLGVKNIVKLIEFLQIYKN